MIVSRETDYLNNRMMPVSLFRQTIPPKRILMATEPGFVHALNKAIDSVDLSDYDYIFRTSGDVGLPRNWIEANLQASHDADVIGSHGDAMLVRVSVLQALGGHFFDNAAEDSYFVQIARLHGASYSKERVKHWNLRKMGATWTGRRFLESGIATWQLGTGPIHMIWNCLWAAVVHRNFRFLARIPCYFWAALSRYDKWPTVKVIRFV